jgi:hypothetical protein
MTTQIRLAKIRTEPTLCSFPRNCPFLDSSSLPISFFHLAWTPVSLPSPLGFLVPPLFSPNWSLSWKSLSFHSLSISISLSSLTIPCALPPHCRHSPPPFPLQRRPPYLKGDLTRHSGAAPTSASTCYEGHRTTHASQLAFGRQWPPSLASPTYLLKSDPTKQTWLHIHHLLPITVPPPTFPLCPRVINAVPLWSQTKLDHNPDLGCLLYLIVEPSSASITLVASIKWVIPFLSFLAVWAVSGLNPVPYLP